MMNMSNYLEKIYTEFETNIASLDCLCKLGSLNYCSLEFPNYNDVLIQQLYLLKYAYGYTYEYFLMYEQAMRELDVRDQVSVLSIGCGALIDYKSLKSLFPNKISYTGIDKVDWNYKAEIKMGDNVELVLKTSAKDYFRRIPQMNADIYMFPKSISELSMEEINEVAQHFGNKQNKKEKFCVCVSLRNTPEHRAEDMAKMEVIGRSIEKNGYKPGDKNNYFYSFTDGGRGIKAYQKEYDYPEHVINGVSNLKEKCKAKGSMDKCAGCGRCLNRFPILRTGEICYRIMKFERRAA